MSDLSRSLVDAAAEAMRAGGFVDPDDDTVPTFFAADSGMAEQGARIDLWVPVDDPAKAAVAAVLETLAVSGELWGSSGLLGLAAEVKTGEDR